MDIFLRKHLFPNTYFDTAILNLNTYLKKYMNIAWNVNTGINSYKFIQRKYYYHIFFCIFFKILISTILLFNNFVKIEIWDFSLISRKKGKIQIEINQ